MAVKWKWNNNTGGGIGGFFGVYEGTKKLYAFGYGMGATDRGAIIAPIDKETYAVETPIIVCTYGIVGNATTPIVDGENFVMANRLLLQAITALPDWLL